MQTQLADFIKHTAQGAEADRILRSCVHCGFCTATCPTYQLLGDELDGPRGRIYLIKQLLEGQPVTRKTQVHLDRCLTCRACETTCPSNVHYSRLLDIGRIVCEKHVARPITEKLLHWGLRAIIPYRKRFAIALSFARLIRPLLPYALSKKIPAAQRKLPKPTKAHKRTMLALQGCAQACATPQTNIAAARVLDRLGIRLLEIKSATCCGAVDFHLNAHQHALQFAKHNIDAWWPSIEQGAEAIAITASGCGSMIKEYAHLLKDDAAYAQKAQRISQLCKDISEVLSNEDLQPLAQTPRTTKVAFHSPCTLQHGQKIKGVVESILLKAGYELTSVNDAHLCCGSAGTYSILQPTLSSRLLTNKISNLERGKPEIIATANVGCQLHMQSKATVPVVHWIELLDESRESIG